MTLQNNEERELEALAMNIVYQLGDALYEALPADVAHEHFVVARQKTNDKLIDFTKKLANTYSHKKLLEGKIQLLKDVHKAGYTWEEPNEGTRHELEKALGELQAQLEDNNHG